MDDIDISNWDQILDWVINAYKKAEENGLTLMGFVVTLVITFIIGLFRKKCFSYLKNLLTWRKKSESSVCQRPSPNTDIQKLLKEICDEAPKKDIEIYNDIREKIEHLNEKQLLKDSIGDLLKNLDFDDQTTIDYFLKLRVALRMKVFEMRPIYNIEDVNINKLDWNGVCQLLEEYVKPNDNDQRLMWYKYIEGNRIEGSVLVKRYTTIVEVLQLNVGQKDSFDSLMNKIGVKNDKGAPGIGLYGNSTAGAIVNSTGGSTTFNQPIKVTGSKKYYGEKPKAKKAPKQNADHDDNHDEDDDDESNTSQ